jgi:hypothetical protein
MALQEFSKIVILKDTQATREAFGPPIKESEILTSGLGAADNTNAFYTRLVGTNVNFQRGWREPYPYIDAALDPGTPPTTGPGSDGSGTNIWVNAVRSNFLQAMTNVEENISNGYNKLPKSSGTAIIFGDELFIGSTSKKTYTGITTGSTEVTVTGTGFTGIAVGSKIRLSSVIGITGLSTATTYYAYAVGSTTLKLASSLANANAGTAITSATGSFSGSAELTVAGSGFTYTQYTDFATPSPNLAVGDFIFWGNDPNDLNIGGKIKTVYTSGAEFDAGARYEFEKTTALATPTDGGIPLAQNIYYYRSSWNGKGIKNLEQNDPTVDIGGGFYVLIKLGGDNNAIIMPYLGFDAARGQNTTSVPDSSDARVISNNLYAFTDLIRIRRISNQYVADESDTGPTEEIIPCTIHRTSNFYYVTPSGPGIDTIDWVGGTLRSVHGGTNDGGFARWAAYYVNPYGGSAGKLAKNTNYVLEVNERLPAVALGSGAAIYGFALNGSI